MCDMTIQYASYGEVFTSEVLRVCVSRASRVGLMCFIDLTAPQQVAWHPLFRGVQGVRITATCIDADHLTSPDPSSLWLILLWTKVGYDNVYGVWP